jgi:hypothetical protein
MTTAAEAPPAWLVAYREQQAGPTPTPAPKARRALATPTLKPYTAGPARAESQGFSLPKQWPYDGCVHREPVYDTDHRPPRVVRRVGWRDCLRCRQHYFSEDIVAQRMCAGCRANSDRFVGRV